jgi:ABC-type maltose transport system permease subunit
MAAACLMTIPTIVLFNAFMKHLAAGLTAGAVKG